MKNYKEETNEKLTYKDLVETETESPYECMLLLEMTRKNQDKVLGDNRLMIMIYEFCGVVF